MGSPKVFISHATEDKDLADALIDVLTSSSDLSPDDILCTSPDGMKLTPGVNFVDRLQKYVADARTVVLLLSETYYDSVFCLCELGAAWALKQDIVPLVVPPLPKSAIGDVLLGIHVGSIDSKEDLSSLMSRIQSKTGKRFRAARWEVQRDRFIGERLPGILSGLPRSQKVARAEYDKVDEQYREAREDIARLEAEIHELKSKVEDLSQCKDREQVTSVLKKHSTEWDLWETAIATASGAFSPLPNVVIDAVYADHCGKHYEPDEYVYDDVMRAVENDYLREVYNGEYVPNNDDPKVYDALCAVRELAKVLSDMPPEFDEWYCEKYSHRPVLSNRRLWSEHLGAT